MRSGGGRGDKKTLFLLPLALLLLFARDAPAHGFNPGHPGTETPTLTAASRDARSASWAQRLGPIQITSMATGRSESVRLYGPDGELDDVARTQLEEVVARDGEPHALEPRLERLLVKAAHHFGDKRVLVVSGWREHAGRHTTGEALDFKLQGVLAGALASYLRSIPRVGVGIYTHPRTQYVHLDVREPSYHWMDGSPPGVTWRERQLRDPGQVKRDASWTPDSDLP
jgi:hypothetical protein